MKYALIAPNELVENWDGSTGYRVADVVSAQFLVADPLYWVECSDEVKADVYYFDTQIKLVPIQPTVDVTDELLNEIFSNKYLITNITDNTSVEMAADTEAGAITKASQLTGLPESNFTATII